VIYDVVFYVAYPYYFPHFLPISKELERGGKKVLYILSDKQNTQLMEMIAQDESLEYVLGEDNLYKTKADFFFFANAYENAKEMQGKTIFLCHGTGTKNCGFEIALRVNDIVIVEGEYRYKQFSKGFPEYKHKLRKLGYSKLDTILNITKEEREKLYNRYHLDPSKKTVLYAPTFFPSSIEKMSNDFPDDFPDCNIIVKPHYLSLQRKRYKNQQKKFDKWAKFGNCQVMGIEEYNLVPFLTIADVMISDESAAIFEFTSLNKPVVINKFLKLRWSYYLNPKKLLKRMDKGIDKYRSIGLNAQNYKQMVQMVKSELSDPSKFEEARLSMAKDICGIVDGKVSQRIVKLLEEI